MATIKKGSIFNYTICGMLIVIFGFGAYSFITKNGYYHYARNNSGHANNKFSPELHTKKSRFHDGTANISVLKDSRSYSYSE